MDKNGPSVYFNRLQYSDKKENVETFIMGQFFLHMKKYGAVFLDNPRQNNQDDFDFTLFLPGGKVYLELTEFVIGNKRDLPYKKFKTMQKYGDIVDKLILRIVEKSKKAKKRKEEKSIAEPIHLLCYVTHCDFLLNDEVVAIVQDELKGIKHEFENIFYLTILNEKECDIKILYPNNNPKINKDLMRKLREKHLVNLI